MGDFLMGLLVGCAIGLVVIAVMALANGMGC